MINALFKYTFLQHAFIAAILASIACGIIGTIIVEKKLVMMSGGIAHTAFGGVGLGYFLKIEPLIGALVFSVISSLGITSIKRKTSTNSDTIIGMFWSMGMALGILFISFMPSYPPDMSSYLFGDILTVSSFDLKLMFIIDLIILFIITSFFNLFKAYLFDEEYCSTLRVNTVFLEYILFILIACTIVVLIRVVGIILVIALLTVPPAIAKEFSLNLKNIMISSIFIGMFLCILGLGISYEFHIPSGASIIMLTVCTYLLILLIKSLRKKIIK
ncbi:metal ABC transporter permease [Clostridium sp. KNHs214]|uniref:metal ABC transporter permease n=1 Tax=Clostridium sp. KNHs214 TaxID=1540257 RepID=UPI000550E562|nr:metal ABC transporter permease [Clostridium sp. KNHs214]